MTGSDGFVARHAIPVFLGAGWSVRSVVRNPGQRSENGAGIVVAGDFHEVDLPLVFLVSFLKKWKRA